METPLSTRTASELGAEGSLDEQAHDLHNAHSSSAQAYTPPPEIIPDISHIITEDDEPVDSINSERQMRLLVESLYTSWKTERPFLATANVGLFYAIKQPPLVPDMMLSLDVSAPRERVWEKHNRSYFVWEYGKVPELVIEIVSNLVGGELDSKFALYEQIGVEYYVVFDPLAQYGSQLVRSFVLQEGRYVQMQHAEFPLLNLRLEVRRSVYEDMEEDWLRWIDADGNLLLAGEEVRRVLTQEQIQREHAEHVALQERERANAERERANAERERANAERERAEVLAAKLRALGINPEEL